jgi:hypothetical protein
MSDYASFSFLSTSHKKSRNDSDSLGVKADEGIGDDLRQQSRQYMQKPRRHDFFL